jgi:undecaprenol kinase/diacylglycerol kinase (ATP)
MKQPSFWRSLTHAYSGLCYTIRTQRNARIHLCAGAVVIIVAVWLGVSVVELSLLVLIIGAILASETVNTTVEAIVDLLSPEWHERAKIAKDIAAGAVLVLSLTAIVIGLLILGPPLWSKVLGLAQTSTT